MNPLMGNGFYRLNTILALLSTEEMTYSVQELSLLLDVAKETLYDDLILIMKEEENSFTVCAEDEELEDFVYSEEFEKKLRSGAYDAVELFVETPFPSDLQMVLTDREWSALSDFLRDREYDMKDRNRRMLIKNSVSAVSDRELALRNSIRMWMEDRKNLELEYEGKSGRVNTFTVRPVRILHNVADDLIYLVAEGQDASGALRLFFYRFDRIHKAAPSDRLLPEADLSDEIRGLDIIWGTEMGEPIHVKLRVYDEVGVADRVRKDLGERAKDHFRKDGDYYLYEDDVIGINKFAVWVRGYGASMIVLEPKELAERMIRSARERIRYYEGGDGPREEQSEKGGI